MCQNYSYSLRRYLILRVKSLSAIHWSHNQIVLRKRDVTKEDLS